MSGMGGGDTSPPWLPGIPPGEPWFPGTSAARHFPAPPPPGFGQVVLPDFASLLLSVSPGLVDPTPVASQAGTGPVEGWAQGPTGPLCVAYPLAGSSAPTRGPVRGALYGLAPCPA
jgi:hypothetical protein